MTKPKYLIFSDLDGSLLDHDTYEFDAALPALKKIAEKRIPLVLASSKTATEIRSLRKRLKNSHPFIVENGAAIYIPEKYFSNPFEYQKIRDGSFVIVLGTRYSKLRTALNQIRASTEVKLVGFGDLTSREVQKIAGLTHRQAEFALEREYDEPFYVANGVDQEDIHRITKVAKEFGFSITQGSRFYHLMGKSDKGQAVRRLITLYKKELQNPFKTVGIGDTINDLQMLQSVDIPILVRKASHEYDREVLARITPELARGIGPKGWNDAVLELLKSLPS